MKAIGRGPLLIFLLLAGITVPAGCRQGSDAGEGKTRVIALSLMTYNNPFFVALKDAASRTAAEHGWTLLEHNAELDPTRQLSAVEDFITRRVDAILLNPVDSRAIVTAVKSANQQGIPVICVDVNADGGEVATFVASDNHALGVMTGEYLVERLAGRGKVGLVTHPYVSSGRDRERGLKEVLARYPEIHIVAGQPSLGDRVKAMEVTENILTAHPDLDAIWAINDPSALGALAAVQSAGRQDDLFIVGIDGAPEAVQAIRDTDTFAATAAQYPQEIGRVGVEMALRYWAGEDLPPFVPTRISLVTDDSVADYPGWK